MLRNKVIVCFSTISWDFLWQRHQELMTRFARADNRVLFVEPIGIRTPKWEDRPRVAARLRNRRHGGTRGLREVTCNLWVVDPLVNPFQQVGIIHRRNVNALTRQIQTALAAIGGGEPIVWAYVPTPLARATIACLPHQLVVYDCVDALWENPKGALATYATAERAFSHEADLILASSPNLFERQRARNSRTYYVPHGVDYNAFAAEGFPEPDMLAPIPRPRLMFFGGIDERLDVELLAQLARAHPDWHIVLLGVVRTSVARLRKYANVHLLGPVSHAALPAFLHHSDLFLLPYCRTTYTAYMNPAKLYECLAVGKPVVATALPIFQEFDDIVCVAANATEFEQTVGEALRQKDDAAARERRRACARANTWDLRFQEINARLEQFL